jgi:hypothetical protein
LEEFSYLKGHPTLLPIQNGQSPVIFFRFPEAPLKQSGVAQTNVCPHGCLIHGQYSAKVVLSLLILMGRQADITLEQRHLWQGPMLGREGIGQGVGSYRIPDQ